MRLSLVPGADHEAEVRLVQQEPQERQQHGGDEQDEHAVAVDVGGAEPEERAGQSTSGTANGLPGRPKVIRTRSGIMIARP